MEAIFLFPHYDILLELFQFLALTKCKISVKFINFVITFGFKKRRIH